jgi:hypothetical protein
VAGALLLFAVRPLVGRWAGRRSARACALDVARLVVAPVLAAFLLSEVLLRHRPAPSVAHFEPDSEGDDRLAWRPIPSHVTDQLVGKRHVRFVIDAEDERIPSEDEPFDPSRPTILFTGESIASGWALPWDETYPKMVGDALDVQPVNVAVQGYANDASYLRLTDAMPRFPHLLATVTMVLPAMIDRNTAIDRPHLVLRPDGSWLTEPRADRSSWPRSLVWDLLEHAVGMHSAEALKRARDIVTATVRETRAKGAVPLVVVFDWPRCMPDATGAESIDRPLFDGIDVAHVHVDVPKDEWDPVTTHPDARGQRRIADVVLAELAKLGVAAPPKASN